MTPSMRRVAIVATLVVGSLAGAAPAPALGQRIEVRALLSRLPVRAEHNGGYDRDRFRAWIDADGDGCDTRAEVLIQESREPVRRTTYCTVISGRWRSVFDGKIYQRASDVDIDHHVPLAEAWGSSARGWPNRRLVRYGNDLGYPRSLNAMTDNLNASKGARDPAGWLPPVRRCRYVVWWMLVKYRWRLSIDRAERRALARILTGRCGDRRVVVPRRAWG